MILKKIEDEADTSIIIEEGNKYLAILFGLNGDLYWTIHNNSDDRKTFNHDDFIITKENIALYGLFEKLFSDFENINIFDMSERVIPSYMESEEEKMNYLIEREKECNKVKNWYRRHNLSHYNEIYDSKNNSITWHSDETARAVSNILKIKKEKDSFILDFSVQPHIDGYDDDFHTNKCIPIRFRNSGSSCDPFNNIFMRMYFRLHDIEDVRSEGHQIDIEEYLYNLDHPKKLERKL